MLKSDVYHSLNFPASIFGLALVTYALWPSFRLIYVGNYRQALNCWCFLSSGLIKTSVLKQNST